MRRDLGNRTNPANRTHMKRPKCEGPPNKVAGDRLRLSVCIYEEYAQSATADTENARNIHEQAP